jgi:addiction module RelE/StbE family toxin
MRIVWTPAATNDLEQISDYLWEQNPVTAVRLVRQIFSAASDLKKFPNRGRPGKKDGTRELVLPGLPYIIIYEVSEQAVRIVRVLHGAQRWP